MGNKGKKRRCGVIFAATILIPTLLWCSVSWLLPDDITLVEGEDTSIALQLPISAKTEDSVGVLGVTTKPLADAFHLELGSSITAQPLQAGQTKVTFYLCNMLPIKTVDATVLPKTELIPVGRTMGVSLDTRGLLVLGTGQVNVSQNDTVQPAKGFLKTGDLLLEANGKKLINKEVFLDVVENCQGKSVTVLLERSGEKKRVEITPIFSEAEKGYKLGVWVRDSIQGIGTVTFYNPQNETFGALGHGVYDVDTGGLMVIKGGCLLGSQLEAIVKGQKGEPGELAGNLIKGTILGEVKSNTEAGIYGTVSSKELFKGEAVPIALRQEVQTGQATILSNIEGDEVKEYKIEIESIGKGNGKDMVIRVTDAELLRKTGGIVQGMSGSPILQNGQLVGAVTHVLVNDPERGYGTLIETMLQEEKAII